MPSHETIALPRRRPSPPAHPRAAPLLAVCAAVWLTACSALPGPANERAEPNATPGSARTAAAAEGTAPASATAPAPASATTARTVDHRPDGTPQTHGRPPMPGSDGDPATARRTGPAAPGASAPVVRRFEGRIAWYGPRFAGRRTANGEIFDPQAMTMAHKTLPFGTWVRVTHLATQRSVTVRVNDRGPFTPGRVADLSKGAARALGITGLGVVQARLEVLGASPGLAVDDSPARTP